ncbi:sensor histidine kinase [Anaerobaca lacustris]|uniref:histidine kinase n=1 Tax=Anaerobaca lacustris TaxID=3044600 RepID=A0AAW6U0Y2_9BACT|nr:HAMP domain-containing sensor histidine kinase [Sedimentisphaerales bacterium M17dextr]
MENLLESTSLIQRAYWLIKLRWVAIGALAAATFVAGRFMEILLPSAALYALAGLLLVYNFVLYDLLRYWTWAGRKPSETRIGRIITFQISVDLLILTTILHFSGGVENPFAFFFTFHMMIASVLCSKWQSYLQATLAVALFGGLVVLEAAGVLPHHALENFAGHGLYRDWRFILGTLFVFTVTLYVLVYMTTSIAEQLRRRQIRYEAANVQLEQKDQLKNEYVLRLTHDIKGHLAAVESCLDIVFGEMVGPLNEKQKDLVERAYHRATKCTRFITALLRLTRMKLTGRLEMETFSLRNCIFNSLGAVQNSAKTKGIVIDHHIDPAVDEVFGEAVLIEETISNMLFNAVKYTPDGGRVSMDVEQDGASVQLRVADSGIGVPEAELTQIFEEFYRADNARAIERDGTGLGLAFAKQVIERHGGRIWAQNNPGGGTTFTFTLPRAARP